MKRTGRRSDNIVWLDLEMTGLDPAKHTIMEIGTVVTDSNLKVIAEGPVLAIHLPESALKRMDSWCVEHHGKSGLTERCRKSQDQHGPGGGPNA